MDNDAIETRIREARPDIVLVAFGHPKQERWIASNRARMKVPVMLGVGGTFEFIAGVTRRAPRWMQRSGTEWVFRLLGDPRRLAGRYVRDLFCLGRHVPKALINRMTS
jgi:N-acetylglucosaminyldiphosphoundecaprenol N-acetyl-beta-D-mannosaminyltransferase